MNAIPLVSYYFCCQGTDYHNLQVSIDYIAADYDHRSQLFLFTTPDRIHATGFCLDSLL